MSEIEDKISRNPELLYRLYNFAAFAQAMKRGIAADQTYEQVLEQTVISLCDVIQEKNATTESDARIRLQLYPIVQLHAARQRDPCCCEVCRVLRNSAP